MLGNQSVKNETPQDKVAPKSQGKNGSSNSNSTTPSEMKAREELNGGKPRYEKGMELYKQGKVSIVGDGLFKVSGYYEIDTAKMKCNCPDYKTNRKSCKHIFACLLFTKNRGKQTIEHLNGLSTNGNGAKFESESKDTFNKPKEVRSKDFNRQSTITRLAVLNTAVAIIQTWGKPVEFSTVISLAASLEKWALGSLSAD